MRAIQLTDFGTDQSLALEARPKGPITTPFFLSEKERCVAAEKASAFRLYRLFGFGSDPRIYSLTGPLDECLALEPVSYRARVVGEGR